MEAVDRGKTNTVKSRVPPPSDELEGCVQEIPSSRSFQRRNSDRSLWFSQPPVLLSVSPPRPIAARQVSSFVLAFILVLLFLFLPRGIACLRIFWLIFCMIFAAFLTNSPPPPPGSSVFPPTTVLSLEAAAEARPRPSRETCPSSSRPSSCARLRAEREFSEAFPYEEGTFHLHPRVLLRQAAA